MLTTALRLYGKNDLRLESFELPAVKDDEILVKIISDSICMSTYKAAMQGSVSQNHFRQHLHVHLQGGDAGQRAQARA